jgi:hypothetical protein
MLKFHFKKPLKDVLGDTILKVFPGVDKVWLISNETSEDRFQLFELNNQKETSQFVSNVEVKPEKYVNSKNYYRWISLSETPLRSDKQARTQFNIFDEYQNRILHLFLPPLDDHFIVFYIFFNEEKSLTGPHSDGRLTTDNKQLIAHTLYHLLSLERDRYIADNTVSKNLQSMQKRMASVQEKESHDHFFSAYVKEQVEKISSQNQINVNISDEAIKYLSEQFLKPNEIRTLLDEVLSWLINFSDINQTHYTIEVSHVVSESKLSDKEVIITKPAHDARYNRTFDLLEKLELAASRAIQNGMRLTGANVGQSYDTPISAPAITDALKKHTSKILTLNKLYPDRWPIIKSQFKPYQNILESEGNFDREIRSA